MSNTKANASSSKRCFTITGEFLTNFARERMFETGWEYSLRLLTDSIIGFGYDRSITVLSGEERIVGTNDLTLDDELDDIRSKHKERLNHAYAGIVFDGKRYFRPYAYVDNWGWKDIGGIGMVWEGTGYAIDKANRSLFYADNKTDVAVLLNIVDDDHFKSTVWVLWSLVSAPPPWMNTHNTLQWQEALDEYIELGKKTLSHRGHQQAFPGVKYPYEPKPKCSSCEKGKPEYNLLSGRCLCSKCWKKEGEPEFFGQTVVESEHQEPQLPTADNDLIGENGWVTPGGTFYACLYGKHIELVDALVYHLVDQNESNPQRRAEILGWVKVQTGIDGVMVLHEADLALTDRQVKTLEDWHYKHKVAFPSWWESKQPLSPK